MSTQPTVAFLFSHPAHFLGLGLGSGMVPKAPGTAGTVLALLPGWFFVGLPLSQQLILLVLAFMLGIYLCGKTAADLGAHDHGAIVWDEFVGLWLALVFVPAGWGWLLAAFVLFRLFDIAKPWPIKWFDQQVHGGLGIMLDDLLAGLFAGFALLAMQVFV